MLQTATNPLAHPTAISVGESHATHVHIVEGGLTIKAGERTLSVSRCGQIHSLGFCLVTYGTP